MINLSISNIAWNSVEDDDIVKILKKYKIEYIDIAPGKYFKNVLSVSHDEVIKVKNYWQKNNIKISAVQSILYKTDNLNIFTFKKDSNEDILHYLEKIMMISNLLGAKKIIFGSPKNRDRGNLNNDEVILKSIIFFRMLGDLAKKYSLDVCLEPNPSIYGCNFMTNTYETIEIIKKVNHDSIKLNLDIGALNINREDIKDLMPICHDIVSYVHLSEPNLISLNNSNFNYRDNIKTIRKFIPNIMFSIEMLNSSKLSNSDNVDKTIKFIQDQI